MSIEAVDVTGNSSCSGAGIWNGGVLAISESTISGNSTFQGGLCDSLGAGIANYKSATINNSTITGNTASGTYGTRGGGILNWSMANLTVNNSTITRNVLAKSGTSAGTEGGGIFNFSGGNLKISSSTISTNGAQFGGNLYGKASVQNSIIANSLSGGNCDGTMTSNGYNLSDGTCEFSGSGDLNNTDAKLSPLQNNGGPTQTIALPSDSPAVDGGNPNGCTDGQGHLLTTDQRGQPRPDREDSGGCDMGAYENQGPASSSLSPRTVRVSFPVPPFSGMERHSQRRYHNFQLIDNKRYGGEGGIRTPDTR